MTIRPTKHGLRLSQHGVVISELRTSPGPTHSVFDLLAALITVLAPAGRLGVLGFAGGGMIAPLRGLGTEAVIDAVDLERSGFDLFRQHCPQWTGGIKWQQAGAVAWLRQQPADFGLLLEDLSVPCAGDIVKPAISWQVLPALIRRHLRPGGVAVFNLFPPPGGKWNPEFQEIVGLFKTARTIRFDTFENRLLVAGDALPTARKLGRDLRDALLQLGSRQARRIHLQTTSAE